jgi:hypothetical protein
MAAEMTQAALRAHRRQLCERTWQAKRMTPSDRRTAARISTIWTGTVAASAGRSLGAAIGTIPVATMQADATKRFRSLVLGMKRADREVDGCPGRRTGSASNRGCPA